MTVSVHLYPINEFAKEWLKKLKERCVMGFNSAPTKEKDAADANDNTAVAEKKKRLTRAERKQAKRERKARWKKKERPAEPS